MRWIRRRGESRPQTEVGRAPLPYTVSELELVIVLADVMNSMLDKTIKAIEEELSEERLLSIGDTVLPHIQHWDRLATLLRDRAIAAVTILPLVLSVSALTIVVVAVITPVYLSVATYK